MKCPACAAILSEAGRACPSCGLALEDSFAPTRRIEDEPRRNSDNGGESAHRVAHPRAHSSASFDSLDGGRFMPGEVLAERYRIISLLGRGGMGEVYRADDLKLGQTVALKFLPAALSQDSAALARLHREVRVARQVSHRHVCRVYDIGEAAGLPFISMEYIKGEELTSLLRRIGRLPENKAVEVARQICAGLAAAHEAGVLHRDLKPANVMIDDAGNARITDFGIAGLAEEFQSGDAYEGTPAYMSPEQLAGKELTVKSDIYSLGLVLYELFTGKLAFEATTFAELLTLRRSATPPPSPSSLVKEIDPVVERVILRCLEREPEKRPASALQVAAALPGGDPLAAALAAGETPSPEMVAAAPKEGVLKPWVAVSLLAAVVISFGLGILASGWTMLHRMVPLEKPPEVLRERAREAARRLGHAEPPTDSSYGFNIIDFPYLRYVRNNDPSPARWERLATGQPPAFLFWYRQSPRYLVPSVSINTQDPPNNKPGMVSLTLDTEGRLVSFEAVPPQRSGEAAQASAPEAQFDWSILFAEAGLNAADFQPTEPQWTPPHAYNARMAWSGAYPNMPDTPVRLEAAAYRGRLVYFDRITPWRDPATALGPTGEIGTSTSTGVLLAIFFGVLIAGVWLALRNLRLGHGDRRGAFRVALFLFIVRMAHWLVASHHTPTFGEVNLLIGGLQSALFWACFAGLLYLALEPFVRRRWPERLISWSRLLTGNFRDPLVGRDILIGAAFVAAMNLNIILAQLIPRWLGWPPNISEMVETDWMLMGTRAFLPHLADQLSAALVQGFMLVFLLLFFSMLLRKDWLGVGAAWLVLSAFFVLSVSDGSPIAWLSNLISTAIIVAAARFGPLAVISAFFFLHIFVFFPVTTELTAWYAGDFLLDLILLAALAVYGFYTSLGGQPLFKGALLDDRN